MQVWFVVAEWQYDGVCEETGRFFASEEAAREYAAYLESLTAAESDYERVLVIEGAV